MEINYINGDITDIESLDVFNPHQYNIILNNVNCQGSLGDVYSYKLREKYPEIELPYTNYVNSVEKNQRRALLGTVLPVAINPNLQVFHLFGQVFYGKEGRFIDYEGLYNALNAVYERLESLNSSCFDIYLPDMIACDRAGGNRNIIKTLIDETLGKLNSNLYAIKYMSSSHQFDNKSSNSFQDNSNNPFPSGGFNGANSYPRINSNTAYENNADFYNQGGNKGSYRNPRLTRRSERSHPNDAWDYKDNRKKW